MVAGRDEQSASLAEAERGKHTKDWTLGSAGDVLTWLVRHMKDNAKVMYPAAFSLLRSFAFSYLSISV